jgi:nudix-type nucleoside diphosphatase (YffH/AdpP family)
MDHLKVLSEEIILDDFFNIKKVRVEFEDGKEGNRFIVEARSAVAILLYRTDTNKVILVKQYRLAAAMNNPADGWLYEIPAGILDKEGESPVETASRECVEETGFEPDRISEIYSFYSSPGQNTEKITLFFATTHKDNQVEEGGGLASEHEDLKIEEFNPEQAFELLNQGIIIDAKTIMALQWLKLQGHNFISG